jgi:hypothetical protein
VVPRQEHYWSDQDDLHCKAVSQSLTINKYMSRKRHFHLVDNTIPHQASRDWKFTVLYEKLNVSFKGFGFFVQNFSCDEQIVKHYGQSNLKQFIRGKPMRFGFKSWVLAGRNGYCFHLSLYKGAENNTGVLSKSSQVVLDMAKLVPHPEQHEIYSDNKFSSFQLCAAFDWNEFPRYRNCKRVSYETFSIEK